MRRPAAAGKSCVHLQGAAWAGWRSCPVSRPGPPALETSSSSSELSSSCLPFGSFDNERFLTKGLREHRPREEIHSLPNHRPNKAETKVLKAESQDEEWFTHLLGFLTNKIKEKPDLQADTRKTNISVFNSPAFFSPSFFFSPQINYLIFLQLDRVSMAL